MLPRRGSIFLCNINALLNGVINTVLLFPFEFLEFLHLLSGKELVYSA